MANPRQLQRVPGYLPYAQPVSPAGYPVPNEAFAFWPQGQLAPEYFPPGHPSFTRFDYNPYYEPMYGYGNTFQPSGARNNPSIPIPENVMWLGVGIVLGYLSHKKGWDTKIKRAIKARL